MKNKWLLFTIIVSLIAGVMLLTGRHFHTHDDIQVFRLNEYIRCWQDGQIPCRWSSDMGKGYGYPYFIFYPPLAYLIPAIIHALTGQSLIFSLNLSAYLTFPLAAYAMYRLVKVLTTSDWLAALAGIMYTFAPYHALNIFVRGVYAENLAWALFPLLLVWTHELIKDNRGQAKLTLGVASLFMTHNISSMLMLPILGLWALLLTYVYRLSLKRMVRWVLAVIVGVGISAWFFVPALLEKKLVQTDSMTIDYYSYLNHFVSLKQIFVSNYWGFGGSGYETIYDGMSFAIGYPLTLGAIISILILLKFGKNNSRLRWLPIIILIAGFVALAMTHAKSTIIWRLIPMLAYIQFPWRFLGVATTLIVVGIFTAISFAPVKLARILALVLTVFTVFLYAGKFRPEKYDDYHDQDFVSGIYKYEQQSAHLYDYLPVWVHSVPDEFHSGAIFRSTQPVSVVDYRVTSRQRTINLNNPLKQNVVFAAYDYPGWQVTIDNNPVEHLREPNYGFIMTEVPEGNHTVELTFASTPLRSVGSGLTVVSIFLLLIMLLIQ